MEVKLLTLMVTVLRRTSWLEQHNKSLTSRTLLRRTLLAAFPPKPFGIWVTVMLSVARRLLGFSEWVAIRAETACLELESLAEEWNID
jgi:hypothetical protein